MKKYDSAREQNVLLEEIRKDVKTIAEGHGALDRKIDKVEANLKSEIAGLRSEMGGLELGMGGLRSEVGGLKSEVGGLKSEVGGLKSEVKELKSEFGTMQIVIMDLDKRTYRIEQKLDVVVTDHEGRIKRLESRHTEH